MRHVLPGRRAHTSFDFVHAGTVFTAGVGTDADGRVREVFLAAGKAGTALEAMSRDAAVVLSLALQYGTPIDEVRRAVTRDDQGRAAGPVGALLDALAAEIAPGTAPRSETATGAPR